MFTWRLYLKLMFFSTIMFLLFSIQPSFAVTESPHSASEQTVTQTADDPHNNTNGVIKIADSMDSMDMSSPSSGEAESHAGTTADPHDPLEDAGHQSANANTETIAYYLMGLVALIGAIAIIKIIRRPTAKPGRTFVYDLFKFKPLLKLVRLKYFRLILQLMNVAVFLTIVYLGFAGVQIENKSVTYTLTWYFWWPIFFLLIVFLGRIWCMVCPFAALADWAQKIVNFNKKFPAKLKNLWVATTLFLILHFAYIWWIRGNPSMTALAVVIGFILPALLVGIVYQRRNYCQYVCPLGGLLTVYSLISPIKVSNRSEQVCKGCKTKDCYKGNELGQGCPVGKVVAKIERTGDCLMCMECVKTCRNDNVAVNLRPFGSDLWNSTKRSLDESTIGVLMVGLVVTKTAIMLEPWNNFVAWFASAVGLGLDFTANLLFVGLTFAFPMVFTLLAVWLIKLYAGKGESGFWDVYKIWGYMMIPVALALQVSHELDHLINESPNVISAIGIWLAPVIPVFQGLATNQFSSHISPNVIFLIKILIPIAGLFFTLLAGYRMANRMYTKPRVIKASLIPMYALTIVFTIVSVYLMGLPMGTH
ncbi:MAG: 4Fe-4S binding protein [Bacillota bacterium]